MQQCSISVFPYNYLQIQIQNKYWQTDITWTQIYSKPEVNTCETISSQEMCRDSRTCNIYDTWREDISFVFYAHQHEHVTNVTSKDTFISKRTCRLTPESAEWPDSLQSDPKTAPQSALLKAAPGSFGCRQDVSQQTLERGVRARQRGVSRVRIPLTRLLARLHLRALLLHLRLRERRVYFFI